LASETGSIWRCLRVTAVVLGVVFIAAAVAFTGFGRWLESPAREPVKSDVVVLLGGDSRARLSTGLRLYRDGYASNIFLAGSDNDRLPAGNTFPNARFEYLLSEGVPRERILIDDMSFNSWEEAANTLGLMRRNRWRTALVVSDPPHMRRLSWIWRRTFEGSDASFVLISSKPRWWNASQWWRDEWSGQFVFMEIIKMGYYFAVR